MSLSEIVDNRERVIKEAMDANPGVSRDCIKSSVILSLIYGGSAGYNTLKNPTFLLRQFKDEIETIQKTISSMNPSIKMQVKKQIKRQKKRDENIEGKTLSRLLQSIENDMLIQMENVFVEHGVPLNTQIPVHDGMMIPKSCLSDDFDMDKVLRECEERIVNVLEYDMKLIVKPMDEHAKRGFVFPTLSPEEITYYSNLSLKMDNQSDGFKFNYLFDREDDFDFTLFKDYIRKQTFESKSLRDKYFLENLPRVLYPLDSPRGWLIKSSKTEVEFIPEKNLPLAHVFYILSADPKDPESVDEEATLELSKYITSPYIYRCLTPIKKIIFEPDLTKKYDYLYNTFTGFEGMTPNCNQLDEMELLEIEPWLYHIRRVIASDDEDIEDYILSYFAHIVQKPNVKTMIFMLLYSEKQRAGKNIILKFLAKYVFGHEYMVERTGLSHILTDNNYDMEKAIICVVNEIQDSSQNYHANFDKLKDMITSDRRRVKKLYSDPYEISDYTNYIGTTNNRSAIRLEQEDARVFALEVSPIHVNDRDYFNKLGKSSTDRIGGLFYRYLLNYNISRDLRDIPSTQLRDDMKDNSKHNVQVFLDEVQEIDWNIPRNDRDKLDEDDWRRGVYHNVDLQKGTVPLKVLYNAYKIYTREAGERKTHSMKFFTTEIEKEFEIIALRRVKNVVLYEVVEKKWDEFKYTCELCEYGTRKSYNLTRHKTKMSHIRKYNKQ